MSFYVVAYDLRKKNEFDYQKLWDAFDAIDSVKFQESDYFVASSQTTAQVKAHFASKIHEDDLLAVVRFSEKPDYTKALKGTNDWIARHFP